MLQLSQFTFFEHRYQDSGVIGEDTIDSHVEQSVHSSSIIDRPHLNMDTHPMESSDEPGSDHRDAALSLGNLKGDPWNS